MPLFLVFLGVGALTFGSGYLLLAFLREAFVLPGLITDNQLLDAVAVGQLTPGPLFTTATFIGYLLMGVPGAVVGTVAIFLPAFVFVALAHPYLARMRASATLGAALDGINAASIGLLLAVAVELGAQRVRRATRSAHRARGGRAGVAIPDRHGLVAPCRRRLWRRRGRLRPRPPRQFAGWP